MTKSYAWIFLAAIGASVLPPVKAADKFTFGRFGEVSVYRPMQVRHAALYFSDDTGLSASDEAVAKELAAQGTLVAAIDLRHYAAELAKPKDKCSYLAGEFEDFSHELQKHFSPERYHQPVLIGVGRSAGLIYGVTAQGSSGTFIGAVTANFDPAWKPLVRLCQSYGLRYDAPTDGNVTFKSTANLSTKWIDVGRSGAKSSAAVKKFISDAGTARLFDVRDEDQSRLAMSKAVAELAEEDRDSKVVADELRDLPLEEVRAPSGRSSKRMAIFLTGDGGWAEIDKGVSAELAARGIDVVALSSLQYFWKPRSPGGTANDVARVLRHYLRAWTKQEVIVVGYSFGADVSAFVVNRLPVELKERVVGVTVLGLAETADFEVHVSTWLGVDHHGVPTKPEVEALVTRVLCVYGDGENDSQCPRLTGANIKVAKIGDGHHFGNRYREIAEAIIDSTRVDSK